MSLVLIMTSDAMSFTKLNRLHLHASDSQAWPIDVPSLPNLAKRGAYQPNLVWSTDQLKRLQRYGIERGVQVYLEFDMPGHTASLAHADPNLIAAFNELDWSTFAAEPLSGQLKLNSSAVYDFLDQFFADILPRIAPYSSIYHGGADEINKMVHLLDESVRSSDWEVLQPLLQKFISYVAGKAQQYGLRPMFWEEPILEWALNLSAFKPLIQVWRDQENIERVLARGYSVIFGDYGYWYLDCGYGSFTNPYPGTGRSPPGVPYNTSGNQSSRSLPPFLDYCAPYKNWRHIYMYNPLEGVRFDLARAIEGGEVLLWNEQTDAQDLNVKLWPRVAAAAEVLWSGPRQLTAIEDASYRLGEWRERLVVDLGVPSSPVQMTWCLMEGGCNL